MLDSPGHVRYTVGKELDMHDVAPPGFAVRRRGNSVAYRLELTTTDRSVAEAISAAAGDHGQAVPAYVLSAAHALATGSDGPSVAVARCLPTDALRAVLKERDRVVLTNCGTCRFDRAPKPLSPGGCEILEADVNGVAKDAPKRVSDWLYVHWDDGLLPGATGCPGWKAKP